MIFDHRALPQGLREAWHLDDHRLYSAICEGALGKITVSSLLISHLQAFINSHNAAQSQQNPAPSLKSLALATILRVLDSADDLYETAEDIVGNLENAPLRDLLTDTRMRYPVLRACVAAANQRLEKGRDFLDIDEAIYYNARYISSRGTRNADDAYLLTLEDFCKTHPVQINDDGSGRLMRQHPPKGGFEVFDKKRENILTIPTTSTAFAASLEKMTRALQYLNWDNLLLAGTFVLKVFLHHGVVIDHDKQSIPLRPNRGHDDEQHGFNSRDMRLYVYGLGVGEAKAKVDEIHAALQSAFCTTHDAITVVKTSIGITFLLPQPDCPVHIEVRLFQNPTEVLLHHEFDQIGYDGRHLLMSPSCARALETGYMTLNASLSVGYQYGNRNVRILRLLEHAELGFGLRLLPMYAKSLSETSDSKPETGLKYLKQLALQAAWGARREHLQSTGKTCLGIMLQILSFLIIVRETPRGRPWRK